MTKRLLIKDFINNKHSILQDTLLSEVIVLMQQKHLNSVIVVEDKTPIGIITERDILRYTSSGVIFKSKIASEIMTSPVYTIYEDSDYRDAYLKMSTLDIRHLSVINKEDEFLGVISEDDLFTNLEYNQFLSIKSIKDVMSKNIYSIHSDDTLEKALSIMTDYKISSIVVVDQNHPVGILTEQDIIKLVNRGASILNNPIKDYMTTPIKVVNEKDTLLNVEEIMKKNHFRHLVVVNHDNEVKGVIAQHDLIKGIPNAYVSYLRKSIKSKEHKLKTINEKLFFDYALTSLKNYLIMVVDRKSCVHYMNNTPLIKKCNINISVGEHISKETANPLFDIFKHLNIKNDKTSQEIELSVNHQDKIYLSTELLPIYEESKFKGYIFIAHNITSSVLSQKALQEEQAQLLQSQKLAKLSNWEFNINTKAFKCSQSMYDMLTLEPSLDITLSQLKKRVSEESYSRLKTLVKDSIFNKKENSLIFKFHLSEKNYLWLEARINFNRRNKLYQVFGTLQDITLRKKREEEINRFKYMVSSINDMVVFVDKEYKYLFANKTYLDFFCVKENRLLTLSVADLVGNERFESEFKDKMNRTFNGETIKFERVYNTTDNEIILQVTYYPYYNNKKEIVGLVAILRDITSEKNNLKLLQNSETRYRTLFEDAKAAMLLIEPISRKIVNANAAAVNFYGYSKEEFLLLTMDKINTLSKEELQEEIRKAKESKKDHFNFKHKLKNGNIRDVEVRSGPITIDEKALIYSIIHDITKRKQAEQKLTLWASVIKNTNEGVVITDRKNRIVDINPAFTKITGYSLDEVKGKSPSILASGRHDQDFFLQMWDSIDNLNSWQGELWNRKKDGTIYPEWININKVVDEYEQVTNYVAVFSDITLIKKSEDNLFHLANHDVLTNLPNRMMLKSQMEYTIKNAKRHHSKFAVLFLDLDNFKMVNDTLGHSYGDEVIQRISNEFLNTIRENDMIARVGGDEFIIVLEDITRVYDIERVCEKILSYFDKPMMVSNTSFKLGVSIGISLYPDNGITSENLIKNADAAMYHSKNSGKNTFKYYSNDMTENMILKLQMDVEIRSAIDNDEFELYYQPQINLNTQETFAIEALLRWNHPTKGVLSPDVFLPYLEESKQIVQLGDTILKKACVQLKKWHKEKKYQGAISVNISAIQIEHGDIVRSVKSALSYSGLDACYLELELTETYVMKNADKTIIILKELKELGVKLAIDDFGTGYSSLSYLKYFPVNRLKIDKSFISSLITEDSDENIVKTIIDLANNMNLEVIAEGVESQKQVDILKKNACDDIQGYLFSKPLSGVDFEKWYKKSKTSV